MHAALSNEESATENGNDEKYSEAIGQNALKIAKQEGKRKIMEAENEYLTVSAVLCGVQWPNCQMVKARSTPTI